MYVGSLFSGIGGIELGFQREGFHTSWFVEKEPYCQAVLKRHFPKAKIYGDITKLDFSGLPKVDILTGGFPCQPHSQAGKRKASKDERDLWPQYYRAICEIRPRWVVAENVPGLISSEGGRFFAGILRDLAQAGYDAEWFTLKASDFGAPHRRERVFIIASPNRFGAHCESHPSGEDSEDKERELSQDDGTGNKQPGSGKDTQAIAFAEPCGRAARPSSDFDSQRCKEQGPIRRRKGIQFVDKGETGKSIDSFITHDWSERIQRFQFETLQGKQGFQRFQDVRRVEDLFKRPDIPEPLVRRGGDGLPRRLDSYLQKERIQAIGNAVVPQVAQFIARRIKEKDDIMEEKKSKCVLCERMCINSEIEIRKGEKQEVWLHLKGGKTQHPPYPSFEGWTKNSAIKDIQEMGLKIENLCVVCEQMTSSSLITYQKKRVCYDCIDEMKKIEDNQEM